MSSTGNSIQYLIITCNEKDPEKSLLCMWIYIFIWSESVSRSVVSNSLWLHGLLHARLPCPWNSPEKNIGVGCHALLQGIFPTQWLNPQPLQLLHCRQILYCWATGEAHKELTAVVAQSPSHVPLFAAPQTATHKTSLSLTISWSLPKFMLIASVMLSSHLILWRPLLLLPSIFPSIRLFQWVVCSHQMTKILKLQLQYQSFQWIFRVHLP